jgi:plastocyanin
LSFSVNPARKHDRIHGRTFPDAKENRMKRIVAIAAGGAVALGLAAAGLASPAKKLPPLLKGEVGPAFTIEVKKAGADLKTVKHGTFRIKVEDKSGAHNFHLMGPGINKKTGIAFMGDKTWTITLKKGTYTYQCDPHAARGMKGTFKVT